MQPTFQQPHYFPLCAIFTASAKHFPVPLSAHSAFPTHPAAPGQLGFCNLPIGTGDLVKVILRIFNLPKLSFRSPPSPLTTSFFWLLILAAFAGFCLLL